MPRARDSLGEDYFDRLYLSDPDPWKFATSEYERAKYAATLNALPRARYSRALEVGCSIGVLTQGIASRCDSVMAIDISAIPLRIAAARCASRSNVDFRQMHFPRQAPSGVFDLIIFSEVLYYLAKRDLQTAADFVIRQAAASGDVVMVHWTGETNYPMTADAAAETFIGFSAASFSVTKRRRTNDYDLIVMRKHGTEGKAAGDNKNV